MNSVVKQAVNMCTVVYIAVGFFGYVANAERPFTGKTKLLLKLFLLLFFYTNIICFIYRYKYLSTLVFLKKKKSGNKGLN